MKIFITGATGFIGKHVVDRLVAKGDQVTINLYGDEKSPFDKNVVTYKLCEDKIDKDIEFFRESSFTGIIHLASLYLTHHYPEDASRLINSNVRFSTHILECASQARVSWFLNTGTFWQHYNNLLVFFLINLTSRKNIFELTTITLSPKL